MSNTTTKSPSTATKPAHLYVIAPTYQAFVEWCADVRLSTHDPLLTLITPGNCRQKLRSAAKGLQYLLLGWPEMTEPQEQRLQEALASRKAEPMCDEEKAAWRTELDAYRFAKLTSTTKGKARLAELLASYAPREADPEADRD